MKSVKQVFDFHSHSTSSDGSDSPEEMLALAMQAELDAWSLTDHDTLAGYHHLMKLRSSGPAAGSLSAPRILPGVELSCDWNNITLHILGLGFDPQAPAITEFLNKQQQRRQQRAVKIGERVQDKLRIAGAYEKACLISGNDLPARPHFATLLIEHSIVDSFADAFKKYLGAGKWGDIKLFWPQMDELLDAVKRSGGLAVVAHPFHYQMTAAKLRRLLDDFGYAGGDAVELAVPNISNGHFGWLANELFKRNLAQSGGSDFHGTFTPWSRLGYFPPLSDKVPSVADLIQ